MIMISLFGYRAIVILNALGVEPPLLPKSDFRHGRVSDPGVAVNGLQSAGIAIKYKFAPDITGLKFSPRIFHQLKFKVFNMV